MVEELVNKLVNEGVALQLTFDIGQKPTVHALFEKDGERLHFAQGDTIIEALEKMEEKLFGE